MPIYDFSCETCNLIHEAIVPMDKEYDWCDCGHAAKRIISVSRSHGIEVTDPAWIASIREVIDKESTNPYDIELMNHPTRANYKRWMKARGLRHLEPGEGPTKPPLPDEGKMTRELWKLHRKRNTIEIRG